MHAGLAQGALRTCRVDGVVVKILAGGRRTVQGIPTILVVDHRAIVCFLGVCVPRHLPGFRGVRIAATIDVRDTGKLRLLDMA